MKITEIEVHEITHEYVDWIAYPPAERRRAHYDSNDNTHDGGFPVGEFPLFL